MKKIINRRDIQDIHSGNIQIEYDEISNLSKKILLPLLMENRNEKVYTLATLLKNQLTISIDSNSNSFFNVLKENDILYIEHLKGIHHEEAYEFLVLTINSKRKKEINLTLIQTIIPKHILGLI